MTNPILFKNKYRAKVYAHMMMMTLYCFAIAALFSRFKFGFIHDYKEDYIAVSILGFIALVILMFVIANNAKNACEKNESKGKQYSWAYIFVSIAALAVSGAIVVYDLKSVIVSFAAAALVFGLSALYAHNSKEDLGKKYGHYFFNIAIGIIALSLVNYFLLHEVKVVNIAISAGCFFLIVFCEILNAQAIDKKLNEITSCNKTQETEVKEKVAENFSLFAGLCVFSIIINLFMEIIQIIGEKDEHKGKSKEAMNFVPIISLEDFNVENAINNIEQNRKIL
jgi:FtsH-binding integral membrane protein